MKTIYKVALISTPITIAVGSTGVYLMLSMKDDDIVSRKDYTKNVFDIDNIYDHYEIFPKLNQEDFYKSIRIDKGKALVDDVMIAKILNYIFDHMQKAQGSIGYNIKRKSDSHVIIYVKWNSPSKEYSHGYDINLEEINNQ